MPRRDEVLTSTFRHFSARITYEASRHRSLFSSPFVCLHHRLEVPRKLCLASYEPPDLVEAERAHRQPDLQRPKLASERNLRVSN